MSSNTAWDNPALLVLIAVVTANVLVASAHFWPETRVAEEAVPERRVSASPAGEAAIAERPPLAARARSQPLDPVVPPNVAKRVALRRPAPVCRAWGPFAALEEAETLARQLALPSRDFEVFHAQVDADPDYLVTLRAPGDRGAVEQVLETLAEQGIDSYILERGPMDNVLAAGVFSVRDRADVQSGRLEALGFESSVEALNRPRDVYHLLARIPADSTPEVPPLGACGEIAPLEQFL